MLFAKKKFFIIGIIIFALVAYISFIMYFNSTKDIRKADEVIREIRAAFDDYRSGDKTFPYITYSSVQGNEYFQKACAQMAVELHQNKEHDLLLVFIEDLKSSDAYSSSITDALSESLITTEDKESAVELIFILDSIASLNTAFHQNVTEYLLNVNDIDTFLKLVKHTGASGYTDSPELIEHYVAQTKDMDAALQVLSLTGYLCTHSCRALNRNTGIMEQYLLEHGTNQITLTPGKGYYAGKKDEATHTVIGITGSPLYDDVVITYLGDFKCVYKSGVTLNNIYQETHYSNCYYYFREVSIVFDPKENTYIWSGDYVFCFSSTGDLIDYSKVN